MKLIHQDGRTQTVPDAHYQRHEATYTRAGWRVAPKQDGDDEGGDTDDGKFLVRSRHNAEKRVTEEEFAPLESAGWVKVDPKAEAEAKAAARTTRKGA